MMNRNSQSEGDRRLTVEGGRVFRRIAVRPFAKEKKETIWLVGELNGVRCYVTEYDVILTDRDINVGEIE